MKEILLKKCMHCGAIVKTVKDCKCEDCGITCCKETMKTIKSNSVDASIEKHMPTYEITDDKIIVKVNHVMEEEHYIEWICLLTDKKEEYMYFLPGDKAIATFDKVSSGKIYSYCNKHGLWLTEIE